MYCKAILEMTVPVQAYLTNNKSLVAAATMMQWCSAYYTPAPLA